MKLLDSIPKVLFRLDDEAALVWSASEVETQLRDGYNQFVRRTKAIFDVKVILNAPVIGDHSAKWEEEYVDIFHDIHNYSSPFEKDWIDNGLGPSGITSPFERTYASGGPSVTELGSEVLEVDRVTFNFVPLYAEYTRGHIPVYTTYESQGGNPEQFTIDSDGKNSLRLIPIPPGDGTIHPFTYSGDTKEIVMDADASEFDVSFIDGPADGIIFDIPGEFPIGSSGPILDVLSETRNARAEFLRQGVSDEYEIPLPLVKYVEFFAMGKLLERDGPGQDIKLSRHYMQRYEVGVARANRRMEKLQTQEPAAFSRADSKQRYPSNWPYNYGIPGKTL